MYIKKDTNKVSEEEKGGGEWGGVVRRVRQFSFHLTFLIVPLKHEKNHFQNM